MSFGGVRAVGQKFRIVPHLPQSWESLAYRVYWQGRELSVEIKKDTVSIHNAGEELEIYLAHGPVILPSNKTITHRYLQ